MNIIPEDEMLNDLATADAAGDTELANAIAGRIKQQRAQAQPDEQAQPDLVSVNAPLDSSAIANPNAEAYTSAVSGKQVTQSVGEQGFGDPRKREQTERALREIDNYLPAPELTARTAPMAVASLAFGPQMAAMNLARSALASATANVAGELSGQVIEEFQGKKNAADSGKLAYAAVTGFIPSGQMLASYIPNRLGLAKIAGGMAERASTLYATNVAGQIAKGAINDPHVNIGEIIKSPEAILSTVVGTGIGALEGAANASQFISSQMSAQRQRLAAIGVNQPTLGMLVSGGPLDFISRMESVAIKRDPALRQQVLTQLNRAGMISGEVMLDTPNASNILDRLAPYNIHLEPLIARQEAAEAAYQGVQGQLTRMGTPTAASIDQAEQALFNRISTQAATREFVLGINPQSPSIESAANQASGNIRDLMQIKRLRGGQLYADAGVPLDAPIISRDDLIGELNRTLRNATGGIDSSPTAVASILETARGLPENLTIAEMREFRGILVNSMNTANVPTDAVQRMATRAYGAATTVMNRSVAARVGNEQNIRFRAASNYNANYASAVDSPMIARLSDPETAVKEMTSVANDLAKGDFSKWKSYNAFVSSVASENPALALQLSQPMRQAVRSSMMTLADDGAGLIDVRKLAEVSRKSAQHGAQHGFDPTVLGFGGSDTIRKWQSIFNKNGLRNLTPVELDSFFNSPGVQQELSTGGAMPITTRLAAETSFARAANEQAALDAIAGIRDTSAGWELTARAQQLTGDRDTATALLQAAQNSPLVVRINQMRGTGGAIAEGAVRQDAAMELTNVLASSTPAYARRFMRALRDSAINDQSLAGLDQLIATRFVKDQVVRFMPADVAGQGAKLDLGRVERFFRSAPGQENSLLVAREVLGNDRFNALRRTANSISVMQDYGRNMRSAGNSAGNDLFTALGIGSTGFTTGGVMKTTMLNRTNEMVKNQMHGAVTALIVNDGLAKSFVRNGGNLLQAVNDMRVPLRMKLLYEIPELEKELADMFGDKKEQQAQKSPQ
jgi:hypothetical protein